jgi:hypothetical protein
LRVRTTPTDLRREGSCGRWIVHTVYARETWINELEDGDELPGSYATKEGAVSAGREQPIGRRTEHVIHNREGTIGERSSYGKVPVSRLG